PRRRRSSRPPARTASRRRLGRRPGPASVHLRGGGKHAPSRVRRPQTLPLLRRLRAQSAHPVPRCGLGQALRRTQVRSDKTSFLLVSVPFLNKQFEISSEEQRNVLEYLIDKPGCSNQERTPDPPQLTTIGGTRPCPRPGPPRRASPNSSRRHSRTRCGCASC